MKNFIEKLKNIGGIIKFMLFVSDCLKAIADTYEKHYPQAKEQPKTEVKEEK